MTVRAAKIRVNRWKPENGLSPPDLPPPGVGLVYSAPKQVNGGGLLRDQESVDGCLVELSFPKPKE
jgi:hypothetical protein